MKKTILSLVLILCSNLVLQAQSVIYDTTHASANGTEISGLANGPATNYGDAIQLAGTDRFLDIIEVDLFNINDETPFDVTMSLYTDCPTLAGTASCGSGVGTLILGSTITVTVTPPAVGTTFKVQFPYNNLDITTETDNTITVMINAAREDVYWTINETPVIGSLPAGDTALSTLTRCGSVGTNNGCTRAFAAPNNNNLGIKITANPNNMGVNDFISNKFSVNPNPAANVIRITNSENISVTGISITDLNGRVVKSTTYSDPSNIQINISDLASGMYLMKIASDKGVATKKIIKN